MRLSKPPRIYPGDWLRLKDQHFPVIAVRVRRCGFGWQVQVEEPSIGDGQFVEINSRWANAREVVEIRER